MKKISKPFLNMPNIPKDFNWITYIELNPDITSNAHFLSEDGAIRHWEKFGSKEGRQYKRVSSDNFKSIGYIKLSNLKKPNPISHGFFSNYFTVLSMIIDSDNQYLRPYVNLDNTSFIENYNPYTDNLPKNPVNTWNWWFEQEPINDTDNIVNIKFSTTNISHSEKMWGRKNLKYIKEFNDKYIKIKPHILKKINDYYAENFKDKIVLGVMARGSEMAHWHPEYGNQTIHTWIESTKNVLIKYPEINVIFLVTEDSNYIPIYLNEFPNTIYLENIFRRTTESDEYVRKYPMWPNIANPRKNHNKLLGEECLIQAKLLGMCDYLLVKHCGTSSAAILFATDNLKDVIYT